jgi:uncharacterized membrane protein
MSKDTQIDSSTAELLIAFLILGFIATCVGGFGLYVDRYDPAWWGLSAIGWLMMVFPAGVYLVFGRGR